MFSHIMVGANDLEMMVSFYDAVLFHAGLQRTNCTGRTNPAGIIWQARNRRWPQFAIRHPLNGQPASSGNGVQVSFQCRSRNAVRQAWKTAVEHGGVDLGAPGDRPIYSDDFYAAYVTDPEGNKLCFLFCDEFATPKP